MIDKLKDVAVDTAKEVGTDYIKSGLGIMQAVKYFIYTVMALLIGGSLVGLYYLIF